MSGFWNGSRFNGGIAFQIFLDDSLRVGFFFAGKNINTIIDLFQRAADAAFCIVALDTGIDCFRKIAKMGGFIVFFNP